MTFLEIPQKLPAHHPSATETCPADRKLLSNIETFQVKYYNDQNAEVTPTEATVCRIIC